MFGEQTFVVAFGSNFHPEENIQRALFAFASQVDKIKLSTAYWSKAVNISGKDFINVLATFECADSTDIIQSSIKTIELRLNRANLKPNCRPMDIDLLLHGNRISDKLPHPDIENFLFVAHPLAELFPKQKHPISGKSFKQIASNLSDQMQLTPIINLF